jgi:hypothetical protein
LPVQERGYANLALDVARGDHAFAHRYRDAVDDGAGSKRRRKRDGERQSGQPGGRGGSQLSLPLQNVCPIEKKN